MCGLPYREPRAALQPRPSRARRRAFRSGYADPTWRFALDQPELTAHSTSSRDPAPRPTPKARSRRDSPTRVALGVALGVALAWILALSLAPPPASALIFASPESEAREAQPSDFPYWEHVVQRRYGGPTVVYLGAGSALTARHVGYGEVHLLDEIYEPDYGSRHTLLNEDGSGADAIVFRLDEDAELPPLPLVEVADRPPEIGEEVLLIGYGRERKKVIEWSDEGRVRFGFEWTDKGRKRWGTNRVTANREQITSAGRSTEIFSFDFDEPNSPLETRHEAHAAVGDSGGAVFVKRKGRWLLAGIMISVSSESSRPRNTTMYGDRTFVADLTYYRGEILRWARPACANELDDDGDLKIDFPIDPGCHAATGRDERDLPTIVPNTRRAWTVGIAGLGLLASGSLALFANRARP